ncbi:MAG: helix-turn-helix transcriptional regulator [Bdellovibrionia bacterium]
MSGKSYLDYLERYNRLTKKREDCGFSRSDLANIVGLTPKRIRNIERGLEVTGGEAKEICRALATRHSEIWVNQDGMIVVREKKRVASREGCHCKL